MSDDVTTAGVNSLTVGADGNAHHLPEVALVHESLLAECDRSAALEAELAQVKAERDNDRALVVTLKNRVGELHDEHDAARRALRDQESLAAQDRDEAVRLLRAVAQEYGLLASAHCECGRCRNCHVRAFLLSMREKADQP